MPIIETIKASDAPPPPKKMAKATAELLAAMNGLKKDEVLRLTARPRQESPRAQDVGGTGGLGQRPQGRVLDR